MIKLQPFIHKTLNMYSSIAYASYRKYNILYNHEHTPIAKEH